MSLEEFVGKRGGGPEEIEKIVESVKQQLGLTQVQVDELRAGLVEAARKGPQEQGFVIEERPTAKWATIALWVFMIALSILLWLMASTGSK
jgi:hypothetical protein